MKIVNRFDSVRIINKLTLMCKRILFWLKSFGLKILLNDASNADKWKCVLTLAKTENCLSFSCSAHFCFLKVLFSCLLEGIKISYVGRSC